MRRILIFIFAMFIVLTSACDSNIINSDSNIINSEKMYNGKFIFTSITSSWVLTNTYFVDSITYNGSINYYSNDKVIINYRENNSEIFKIDDRGNFISEGDWYYEASKKGGFINTDSLMFLLRSPGPRSGTLVTVEGKRIQ
jgi:hypothetical protein